MFFFLAVAKVVFYVIILLMAKGKIKVLNVYLYVCNKFNCI